jgi:hypothetical protein
LLHHPEKGSFKMTITQILMMVRGMNSIAHPQVADGGDNLQIWRVNANQSWIAHKRWSSILGVGEGTNNASL